MRVWTRFHRPVKWKLFCQILAQHQQSSFCALLNTQFLGHTIADDNLTKFNNAVSLLDPNRMIQVSIGGPQTNLKFLESLKSHWIENEKSQLIDKGPCGLHWIHGAFKTSSERIDWELKNVFRGALNLLYDSPARMDNFISVTGSDNFPLYFCATRCVKDRKIANRLIDIRTLWQRL